MKQERVFIYIVPSLGEDIILGILWIDRWDMRVNGPYSELYFGKTGHIVKAKWLTEALYKEAK
jgi:hypothetical protein